MNAYNYITNKIPFGWTYDDKGREKRAYKTPEQARKYCEKLTGKLGIESGIFRGGKIHCSSESTAIELEPGLFGVPFDCPEGEEIYFVGEEKGKIYKKEKMFRDCFRGIYNSEWLLNDHFIFRRIGGLELPMLGRGGTWEENDDLVKRFISGEPEEKNLVSWDRIKKGEAGRGVPVLVLSDEICVQTKYLEFFEANSKGLLSFHCTNVNQPIWIYNNGILLGAVMVYNDDFVVTGPRKTKR